MGVWVFSRDALAHLYIFIGLSECSDKVLRRHLGFRAQGLVGMVSVEQVYRVYTCENPHKSRSPSV